MVSLLVLASPILANAEPTEVHVRVLGKGSTFVGSGTGGMQITLSDAESGTVLVEGITEGSSGDAQRIMGTAKKRDDILHTDDSAVFKTTVDISVPTLLRLRAFGPVGRDGGQMNVTSTHWVLPGKHLTKGNGWLVELPGFLIEPLWPAAGDELVEDLPVSDTLRVHITPMCGCAIKAGGYWPPENYDVVVDLSRNGKAVSSSRLTYSGQPSVFQAPLTLRQSGSYEALISIYDASNGNAGVKKVRFSVEETDSD